MANNILIAIITYNRPDLYSKVFESVKDSNIDIISIKDGSDVVYENDFFIKNDINLGVGKCKKQACDYFLSNPKYDHLFILEDDCYVKNINVFDACIGFRNQSGLTHFNWNSYRYKDFLINVNYRNYAAKAYINAEASFSYFDKIFLRKCMFDVQYMNAWEHLDLEMQGHVKAFLPPFRCFVSPDFLDDMLECIDQGESSISGKFMWQERVHKGALHFKKKWGLFVNEIPFPTKDEIIESLKIIKEIYAK
jgi:hypothetical protein